MAANSQQFGVLQEVSVKGLNETNSKVEQQLAQLTSMVQQMALGHQVRPCGICQLVGHSTDACLTLQEDINEHVNAMGGFPGQPRQRYDPYAITYNEGWKEHPNLRYGNQQQTVPTRPPRFPYQQRQQQTYTPQPQQSITSQAQDPSMADMLKQLIASNMQTQALLQGAHVSLKNLENSMGQIATSLSQNEPQNQRKLPSQPVRNPRENANAITLRDGKTYDPPTIPSNSNDASLPPTQSSQQDNDETPTTSPNLKPTISPYVTTPPFPSRLRKTKKDEAEQEILETFCKVEVNIPLLDVIKQVPRYAKFLKDLCTNKRKLKGNEKVSVGQNVSAVLQKKLPPKCKDPDIFTIPCTIGNKRIERCMLDLGASMNVMSYSIYASLNLGPLEETGVIIQLADRSNAYPRGVVEDVLVKVNELVFLADFYILDMEDDSISCSTPVLLGRPFLKTARTKIDVHKGTLTMEFDGEVIRFNIFEAMRYPSDVHSFSSIDILDSLSQRILDSHGDDGLDIVLREPIDMKEDFVTTEVKETVAALNSGGEVSKAVSFLKLPISHEQLQPSVKSPPKLELKPLPKHLKYVYLGEKETLPVIITTKLTQVQEDRLIRVLWEYKTTIGWTIADIKGISTTMCMHHILLEDGSKPSREAQRRLNQPMMEVVKKEILKLLSVGVIYPISDSKWVSPVQVVQVGVIRHHCGYNQIVIAPEDQEKTAFTCPFGTFAFRRMPFRLCNAPATFQRCMCHFMVQQGIVLGHVISEKGIGVGKAKIDLIRAIPPLSSVKEIRSFLGHAGFYRQFIKDFSKIASPLCNLLQKDVAFEFNDKCLFAFNKLKESLTSTPIIQPPNWDFPFEIMCDASDYPIGAVLGQRVGKVPDVIYYASRTLNDAQLNYSTTEKEFLAVIFSLEIFWSYLIGTKVIVYIDHATLKYLLAKKEAKPRLIWWILLLQEFDLEIKDKRGSENLVADHLSRLIRDEDNLQLNEKFPDEQLLALKEVIPWFVDIVNYLATKELPGDLTQAQKNKIKHDAKFYIWDEPYLWKHCADQVI
ncbi:uncharacterized protein LOC133792316 [Humulus lupulus]|uniref:uncharacterized protein LOC133792316 n=1 Tax=Humulus lupulus TaxID=3486 RepID=UPI002B4075EC|nr:uncharacterized protein LOC133792316 [Humulus lupulus]